MLLRDWELTIQQIMDESTQEQNEGRKRKILTAWRAKLEKEPTSLLPFRIDEIMREVRRRLGSASR